MLKKPTVPDFLTKKVEETTPTVETPVETQAPQATPEVKLDHNAYSLVKDGGYWFLVKIPFDFKTLTIGTPQKVSDGENRALAIERFKVATGPMFMADQNG